MAASAWTIFNRAKHKIGSGVIDLSSDDFRLTLHRTSASLTSAGKSITVAGSVGFLASGGGAATITGVLLTNVTWTGVASIHDATQRFDCSDPVITASASTLSGVRYAVIRNSVNATSGHLLCYAALSTAQFNVSTGNTLTIQMNANGIFTLT